MFLLLFFLCLKNVMDIPHPHQAEFLVLLLHHAHFLMLLLHHAHFLVRLLRHAHFLVLLFHHDLHCQNLCTHLFRGHHFSLSPCKYIQVITLDRTTYCLCFLLLLFLFGTRSRGLSFLRAFKTDMSWFSLAIFISVKNNSQ